MKDISDQEQERSNFLEFLLLIHKNHFFKNAFMGDFGPQVIEVKGFSHLVTLFAWHGHGFKLNKRLLSIT